MSRALSFVRISLLLSRSRTRIRLGHDFDLTCVLRHFIATTTLSGNGGRYGFTWPCHPPCRCWPRAGRGATRVPEGKRKGQHTSVTEETRVAVSLTCKCFLLASMDFLNALSFSFSYLRWDGKQG